MISKNLISHTVLIVDDYPIWREGIAAILSTDSHLEIVGQVGTGQEALDLAFELRPDVILLDVNLPDMNGIQVAHLLKESPLKTKIIIMTAYDDQIQLLHVMQAGCHGYLGKDIVPSVLVKAILGVTENFYFVKHQEFTPSGLQEWLDNQLVDQPYLLTPFGQGGLLSRREMEILTCLSYGQNNHEIASSLNIRYQTVKNHVSSILAKLNVEDRFQAALFAIQHGWVRLPEA